MADPASDFAQIAQMGAEEQGKTPDYSQEYGRQLQQAMAPQFQKGLDDFRRLGVNLAERSKMQADPMAGVEKMSVDKNGKMQATFHKDTFEALMRDHQELNTIRGAFHQEAERLKQQEEQVRQHPWQQVATALSANLAQAKDLPGWVQAAGRTAAQLNPTADQLRNQRLTVLGEEANLAERGAALSEASLRRQEVSGQKQIEDQDKRIKTFMQDVRLSAKPGEPMLRATFEAKADLANIPEDKRQALYEGHVGQAGAVVKQEERKTGEAKKLLTFRESLREQGDVKRGEIAKGVKIAGINTAFQNSVSPTKMAFEETLHEHKKAIDEAAASSKEFKLLGPVGKGLTQASATNGYLGTVEHMLEQPEFAEVQGPLFSFDPKTKEFKFNVEAKLPKQFKGIERTQVESQISHEIPRLLTLLLNGQAGGASILRTDIGKKLVSDMGITGQVRADQALAILKVVRDSNNNNVAAIMRTKPKANFGEIRDLLGATDARNDYFFKDKKDSFGGPVVPFPDVNRRGSDKASAPQDHGAATGFKEGRTANGGKLIVKNGRWVDAD